MDRSTFWQHQPTCYSQLEIHQLHSIQASTIRVTSHYPRLASSFCKGGHRGTQVLSLNLNPTNMGN